METKFTKGKWYWEWDECDCEYPCSCGLLPVQLRSKMDDGNTKPVIYRSEDISGVDAHLIAAAPEMYEMLERIIANYQEAASVCEHEGYETKYDQDAILVKLLLAKARGETL